MSRNRIWHKAHKGMTEKQVSECNCQLCKSTNVYATRHK